MITCIRKAVAIEDFNVEPILSETQIFHLVTELIQIKSTQEIDLGHFMKMEAIWILTNLLSGTEDHVDILLGLKPNFQETSF